MLLRSGSKLVRGYGRVLRENGGEILYRYLVRSDQGVSRNSSYSSISGGYSVVCRSAEKTFLSSVLLLYRPSPQVIAQKKLIISHSQHAVCAILSASNCSPEDTMLLSGVTPDTTSAPCLGVCGSGGLSLG